VSDAYKTKSNSSDGYLDLYSVIMLNLRVSLAYT